MNKPERVSEVRVLMRGAGELASAIAHRLRSAGFSIAMTELENPLAIRRHVSFCECIHDGTRQVEGVTARRVSSASEFSETIAAGEIPVIVDPGLASIGEWKPHILLDAAIAKRNLGTTRDMAPLVVGYGPGFTAGEDVDIVIETNRGHDLGRLIREGAAAPDTGIPGVIAGESARRVIHSPDTGILEPVVSIGDLVKEGDLLARVGGSDVTSPLSGVVRGLIRPGSKVKAGLKIADVDPRGIVAYCDSISEKGRNLGGSALEAILSWMNEK